MIFYFNFFISNIYKYKRNGDNIITIYINVMYICICVYVRVYMCINKMTIYVICMYIVCMSCVCRMYVVCMSYVCRVCACACAYVCRVCACACACAYVVYVDTICLA
jgi:hypothetical protein